MSRYEGVVLRIASEVLGLVVRKYRASRGKLGSRTLLARFVHVFTVEKCL